MTNFEPFSEEAMAMWDRMNDKKDEDRAQQLQKKQSPKHLPRKGSVVALMREQQRQLLQNRALFMDIYAH